MLLQTNSYIVPRDKRMEHARLLRRFRQTLMRLGCDHFEVFEQVGANWNTGETTGRFVQIMRFRDRKHQLSVQGAERTDPVAQALVREFCELINFSYQQQQGLFAVGFYTSFLRMPPQRTTSAASVESEGEAEPVTIDPDAPTSAEPGIVSLTGGPVTTKQGEPEPMLDGSDMSEEQGAPIRNQRPLSPMEIRRVDDDDLFVEAEVEEVNPAAAPSGPQVRAPESGVHPADRIAPPPGW
jgi:hypothetical protein